MSSTNPDHIVRRLMMQMEALRKPGAHLWSGFVLDINVSFLIKDPLHTNLTSAYKVCNPFETGIAIFVQPDH